uniref:Uncharacterized protein n=1 Tax=Globodera rostochiensis TaxID=31243 RepID=A0A914HZQ7_GLORO
MFIGIADQPKRNSLTARAASCARRPLACGVHLSLPLLACGAPLEHAACAVLRAQIRVGRFNDGYASIQCAQQFVQLRVSAAYQSEFRFFCSTQISRRLHNGQCQ